MTYCTPKLEYSPDPLSDTTPTWIDITTYCMEADWFSGKSRDLDEPQAGGATFRLKNVGRRFEPEYAAGAYYPNIVPLRRLRWSITADGVSYPQGVYYAQSWQVTYPAGTTYSECVVSCTDGFGLLSLANLPTLDPPTAETYEDVVAFDNPFAYYKLDEQFGSTIAAVVGPEGQWRGNVGHVLPNPVTGSSDRAAFIGTSAGANPYGRVKIEDNSQYFVDKSSFTLEAVATVSSASDHDIATGPWITADGEPQFVLANGRAQIRVEAGAGDVTKVLNGTIASGAHHHCATWDGSLFSYYRDGILEASVAATSNLTTADAAEYMYLGGRAHTTSYGTALTFSHVAYYDYALPADRVAAHAAAAITQGYAPQTAGTRVAALATDPLWSVASIPAGQITTSAVMQTGQGRLDQLLEAVKAETPLSLFYFDEDGNPAYRPWDYGTTLQATLGETEVQYDQLGLQYDDELFNRSTVSGELGIAQTAEDAASLAAYHLRVHDETGLPIRDDTDAALISQTFVDRFKDPMYRIETISLNGAAQNRRTQILSREIGDTIRVKRRGEGGTANPDVITRILGYQKHLDRDSDLRCTWNLARGFSATQQGWRLGQVGYAELGVNTYLA